MLRIGRQPVQRTIRSTLPNPSALCKSRSAKNRSAKLTSPGSYGFGMIVVTKFRDRLLANAHHIRHGS